MADVAAASDALSRGSWDEALELVRGAERDPGALEAAGAAHWCLDDADATIAARAISLATQVGRAGRAGSDRRSDAGNCSL